MYSNEGVLDPRIPCFFWEIGYWWSGGGGCTSILSKWFVRLMQVSVGFQWLQKGSHRVIKGWACNALSFRNFEANLRASLCQFTPLISATFPIVKLALPVTHIAKKN